MTINFDDFITCSQAAALTGRAPGTVIRWINIGALIPAHTAGRTRLLHRDDVLRAAAEMDQRSVNVTRRKNTAAREAMARELAEA
ncbi:MAG: helix-turn-helix domain-containing protein [Gemmatimonadota bacterium]|nr:helix-turn-helix domain-containing protein [Gemmatimonadota bacterium]